VLLNKTSAAVKLVGDARLAWSALETALFLPNALHGKPSRPTQTGRITEGFALYWRDI
jgi:hypothetical protein